MKLGSTMNANDLGNQLNKIVNDARNALFRQSELARLTYGAFEIAFSKVQTDEADTVDITFPIGWTAENQPIPFNKTYTKQELLSHYQYLGLRQLAINGIVHLVTLIEAMMNDLLRTVIRKYPLKLGNDKKIPLAVVLGSSSIEMIHLNAIDSLLNDLAYKSPTEYARAVDEHIDLNPLECSAFHKFVELKATRDVYIHNQGFANDIYVRKSGTHARVAAGNFLPADLQYFHASFEQCVQLTEWWEQQLHIKWHSSDHEARRNRTLSEPDEVGNAPSDAVSEQLHALALQLAGTASDGSKP